MKSKSKTYKPLIIISTLIVLFLGIFKCSADLDEEKNGDLSIKQTTSTSGTQKNPTSWNIAIMGVFASTEMSEVNNSIKWLNKVSNGDIPKIQTAAGGSTMVIYQLNETIGVGFSYEYLSASSKGFIDSDIYFYIYPPVNKRVIHSYDVSTHGFLGIATLTIPQSIKKLDIKALVGLGAYYSMYEEEEKELGIKLAGNDTSFGYKAGLGLYYVFTDNFGICGEISYRGIKTNLFYHGGHGANPVYCGNNSYCGGVIEIDFSGIGATVGIFFRL